MQNHRLHFSEDLVMAKDLDMAQIWEVSLSYYLPKSESPQAQSLIITNTRINFYFYQLCSLSRGLTL